MQSQYEPDRDCVVCGGSVNFMRLAVRLLQGLLQSLREAAGPLELGWGKRRS
jgi:hypothetical protein